MEVLEQVRDYCAEYDLLKAGEVNLLAVSGGSDSVALLYILHSLAPEIGFEISVAHLEHGLRGSDSLDDQRFVKKLSEELGVVFHTKSVDVQESRRRGEDVKEVVKESVEEAARRLRYDFLFGLLQAEGYSNIATGHTLDDNVETVLFRMISGTGASGFSGILPRAGKVIHPLLCLSREHIGYRTDMTNYDRRYPRNRIRHEVTPVLRDINVRYREHIQRLVDIVREESNLVDRVAKEQLEKVIVERTLDTVKLSCREFLDLDPAVRRRAIIRIAEHLSSRAGFLHRTYFDRIHLPYKIINSLTECDPNGNRTLYRKGLLDVRVEYGMLVFKKRVVTEQDKTYLYCVEKIDSPVRIGEVQREAVFRIRDQVEAFENSKLYFDYRKLKFPIVIRSRKKGDRISLVNLGSKKIKSLFIDEKVPKDLRQSVPIIESNGEICGVFLSICGKKNRCASQVMITAGTKKILECELV
jgi:tRNA(Ile)-lysidine synthase